MKTVITGSTKGIGRAIAEAFAREGHDLAICARNENDLKNFQSELQDKYGIKVIQKPTDVAKKEQVIAFADYIKSEWSQVDVLVNNAGVYFPGDVHSEEDGTLEALIETNLYSAYNLTRALLPVMLPQAKGHIFNICSVASLIALPGGGSYSISKFAMLGFNKVLREEMKDKGIRVTAVMPGATWSHSWDAMKDQLPESRLMKASDVAAAVWGAYKLSDQAVIEELVMRPQLGDL